MTKTSIAIINSVYWSLFKRDFMLTVQEFEPKFNLSSQSNQKFENKSIENVNRKKISTDNFLECLAALAATVVVVFFNSNFTPKLSEPSLSGEVFYANLNVISNVGFSFYFAILTVSALWKLRMRTYSKEKKEILSDDNNQIETLGDRQKKDIKYQQNVQEAQPFPNELYNAILNYCPFKKMVFLATVNRDWCKMVCQLTIHRINKEKILFKKIFISSDQAIEYLTTNSCSLLLKYANFSKLSDFDGNHFYRLAKSCPNTKHLIIPGSRVKGNVLQLLEYFTGLHTLDIGWCKQLATNALDNLRHTTQLTILKIGGCDQLDASALDNLGYTKHLKILTIGWCQQLATNALDNLRHTKGLKILKIAGCDQLAANTLDNLKWTPELEYLDMEYCDQLSANALNNNPTDTPLLEYLGVEGCSQFDDVIIQNLRAIYFELIIYKPD